MYSKPSGVGPESLLSAQDPGAQSPTCLHSSPRCRRLVFIQSGRRVPSIGAAMVEFQSAPDKTRLQILRETSNFDDAAIDKIAIVSAVGVGLQIALPALEEGGRMFSRAISGELVNQQRLQSSTSPRHTHSRAVVVLPARPFCHGNGVSSLARISPRLS